MRSRAFETFREIAARIGDVDAQWCVPPTHYVGVAVRRVQHLRITAWIQGGQQQPGSRQLHKK
ncbi:MAG: hypothetical protein JF631_00765 [Mycobacterium sp.]|nr:hypothetical protein [Mycobacterium sp.]